MEESKLFGVSVRGWLSVFLTITLCVLALIGKKVEEPFYSVVIMCVSFYFGKMSNPKP